MNNNKLCGDIVSKVPNNITFAKRIRSLTINVLTLKYSEKNMVRTSTQFYIPECSVNPSLIFEKNLIAYKYVYVKH